MKIERFFLRREFIGATTTTTTMDVEDFRVVLESCGVDVWTFIETAIAVAAADYGAELKLRRDGIVERLYAGPSSSSSAPAEQARCGNCDDVDDRRVDICLVKEPAEKGGSPGTPQSVEREDGEDLDPYAGMFDDEQKKILEIKEQLEDPHQSEDFVVELLQALADMDITFQALKETDIGRHVNRFRKHQSQDVRRVVKQLVRKWKDIVDEWVKLNPPGERTSSASALMADGDSPQQKIPQNGHQQVPDFGYSPNPHNGSSGSDRNNSEYEPKPKAIPRKEAPPRPAHSAPPSAASAHQNRQREQKDFDNEKLASARKRLQENYKEAENAKRQRTIQVMDIHDIPKPKNTFFAKNKGGGGGGGGGSHGRHW